MNNKVRQKLMKDEVVLGTFFHMGSAEAIEALGIAQLDYVIIDTEHAPFDTESTAEYIRTAELKGLTPFVRIKDITRPSILKMLDIGAKGLIIPFVKSVEEAHKIVEYGKYAPIGNRGFVFPRVAEYGYSSIAANIEAYMDLCNRNTMLIPQCETVGCLNSIEEIVAIEGIDGIFVGPYDLSIALKIPGQFDNPVFKDALNRILNACNEVNKPAFIFSGSVDDCKSYIEAGFKGIVYNVDVTIFIDCFKKIKNKILG